MLRIVFWQNELSIHQSALIRNLAIEPKYAVTLVVKQKVPEYRRKMGWYEPDFGNTQIITEPDEIMVERIFQEDPKQSIHIFSGFRYDPVIKNALRKALKTEITIGVYAESLNLRGIKGWLRQFRSRYDAWCYASHIDFFLAIGHIGMRWYQQAGFPSEKLYPFGYFTEFIYNSEREQTNNNKKFATVRLVFIGQLIVRKGVDILLKALAALTNLDWKLDIIGDGPERRRLEIESESLGLSSHVCFRGIMENIQAMSMVNNNDILILPSRFEGWGAVVNEALVRGIPVICTDSCGAADLLTDSMLGEIVKAGSVEALRKALKKWIEQGQINIEKRQKIQEWANCISGISAARYLQQIISHVRDKTPRPNAPWL
jgi:glycosyltransferase involved in cell wall biosynthesis